MIEIILDLIEKSGKRPSHLEKEIGLANGTIGNWKQGRYKVSVEALTKLATYFGVSIDYLCTGKERTPTVNQGIFGDQNSHNTVTINGSSTVVLDEMETELLKVFAILDIRRKTALLSKAYELEKEINLK